jgi:UDP-glucose:tetrahydrobiopterin glucosyltransferase
MVAPMVAPLSEPHLGGAQAFLADLARGLQTRGHDVHVYAASGSALPGVTVIDTGVDAGTVRDCLYRPGTPRAGGAAAGAAEAFARAYAAIRDAGYDLVHNHAFDPPAITCARSVPAPVVHTLHLPPDREVAAALAAARRSLRPPAVAAVSRAHRRAWRLLAPIDAVLPNGVPTARIPWSDAPGSGLVFAGRLSPEKGAAEAIDIARAARASIDVYGDPYDRTYAEGRIYPRDGEPRSRRPSSTA